MRSRTLAAFAAVFCLFVSVTAFAADQVKTDYDHTANFERYHTYSWQKVQTDNPFYKSRIQDGIDHYLQQQGWERVPTGGDVSLFAVGDVKDQKSLETYYNGLGGGWGWGGWGWGGWDDGPDMSTTRTVDQRVRTVVVDMYDSKTKHLLWRGTTKEDLSDKTDKNVHKLYEDFATMFHNFPPRS